MNNQTIQTNDDNCLSKLNHPWKTYHNAPMSSYQYFDVYKTETLRLFQFLKQYIPKSQTVFQLIVGAAMEEALEHEIPIGDQWRQLFPYYLEELVLDEGLKAQVVIVSPNKNFLEEEYHPTFIGMTNWKYHWEMTGPREFTSTTYPVKINLFCTMFPQVDKFNSKLVDYWKDVSYIEQFVQTDMDVSFVNDFYKSMSAMFAKVEQVDGVILAVSYAVFNNIRRPAYYLIPSIKDLFPIQKKDTRMLFEWRYAPTYYIIHPLNNTESEGISYMERSSIYSDGNMLCIYTDSKIDKQLKLDIILD